MTDDAKKHWETIYETRDSCDLGWYEESPDACMDMFSRCDIDTSDLILEVGAGTSSFIRCLMDAGHTNIAAVDISQAALDESKRQLGAESAEKVVWIADDLSAPKKITELGKVSLWHDRAVLHFLTDEKDQATYFNTLKDLIRTGGYVIIAVFSLDGAKRCAGLDLKRYDVGMLAQKLGDDFKLIHSFDHVFIAPSGHERPYVYALFQRTAP